MSPGVVERKRILDPIDRAMEVLFGLIMVLSFTGTLSAAEAGREDVRTMLIGALGCNLAWGIVDGVMYIMTALGDRMRGIVMVRRVRGAPSPEDAHGRIAVALPEEIASAVGTAELEAIRRRVAELPEPPRFARPRWDDYKGALAVFLLVFLSTFPVTIPFLFMQDAVRALRISNAIAVAMLFVVGYRLGKESGGRPWRIGLAMVAIGLVLVAVTIALGG